MKIVKVVAAVICNFIKKKHKIFATARGYREFKYQCEFHGGKIEEEVDSKIKLYDLIDTI